MSVQRSAFDLGWVYGNVFGPASPVDAHECMAAHGLDCSSGNVEAFCNGSDDGYANDRWRLDQEQGRAIETKEVRR